MKRVVAIPQSAFSGKRPRRNEPKKRTAFEESESEESESDNQKVEMSDFIMKDILCAMVVTHNLLGRYKVYSSDFWVATKCVLAVWSVMLGQTINYVAVCDKMSRVEIRKTMVHYTELLREPQTLIVAAKAMPFCETYEEARKRHQSIANDPNAEAALLKKKFKDFSRAHQGDSRWACLLVDFSLDICSKAGEWSQRLRETSEWLPDQRRIADGSTNLSYYVDDLVFREELRQYHLREEEDKERGYQQRIRKLEEELYKKRKINNSQVF